MPESGIKALDEVKIAYQQVHKMGKGIPYAVFKFSDDLKNVVIDQNADFYSQRLHLEELIQKLPPAEPRFIVFEFPFIDNQTNGQSTVPIFMSWHPSSCKMKMKFITGSTARSLYNDLGGKSYMEGEDASDLNEDEICKKNNWTKLTGDKRPDYTGQSVDVLKTD